jgi:hypothetical protein
MRTTWDDFPAVLRASAKAASSSLPNDPVDETDAKRVLRRNQVAGEQHLDLAQAARG